MSGARRSGRLSLALHIVAGTLGAYVLAALGTVAMSLLLAWLEVDRREAALAAALAGFAFVAGAVLAVFHAKSAARAWLWIGALAAPLTLLSWILAAGGRP